MTDPRRSTLLFCIALLLITAIAYLPGLRGEFLFDDFPNIVQKDAIHATELSSEAMTRAMGAYRGPPGRPVATVSFAIDHLIWGLDPFGYKLTSLLVHLVNTLLVFTLVRRLLPLSNAPTSWGLAPAFAIAAIWALHPLQVSTVHYIVQRMEMLSLTFVLLALIAYIKGRRNQQAGKKGWPWLLSCIPLVTLGLLSKETAALFPAYALALELTLLRFGAASARTSRAWRIAFAVGTVAALAAFLGLVLPHYVGPDAFNLRDFGAAERLLTQFRILPRYLAWILVPQPASYVFYYDNFAASQGILQPLTTLGGAILVIALVSAAFALRRRLPMVSLGIFWFFASHLLTSNVIPLELVFEHRNYFAILGVLLAAGEVVRRLPESEIPRVRLLAVGAVVAGVFVLTLIRSATWGDGITLAMEFASKNPGSSRASLDLGEQYLKLARNDARSPLFAKGMAELERGSRVPGASPMPEQGLIVYAAMAGVPADPEWWDRVVWKLSNRAIGPQETSMIVDLLSMRREGVLFDDRRFAEAYMVLVDRLEMPPTQYFAFGEHALEYARDPELAEKLFLLAVEKGKDDPELVTAMVDAIWREGHPSLARAMAGRAEAIGIARIVVPDAPPAANKDAGN